jgi:hypothetical protein
MPDTFSAGLDRDGNASFFGVKADAQPDGTLVADSRQIWAWNSTGYTATAGWHRLGSPGQTRHISATTNGQVWFLDRDALLYKFDAFGGLHDLNDNPQDPNRANRYVQFSAAASNDVYVLYDGASGVDLMERQRERAWTTWATDLWG